MEDIEKRKGWVMIPQMNEYSEHYGLYLYIMQVFDSLCDVIETKNGIYIKTYLCKSKLFRELKDGEDIPEYTLVFKYVDCAYQFVEMKKIIR